MEVANKYGLPEYIAKVVSKTYPPKYYRIGVTDLIHASLPRILRIIFWDRMTEDVSDKLWMFFGLMGHAVQENIGLPEDISEEKLVTEAAIDSKKVQIVGRIDLQTSAGLIKDFKFTSVWSYIFSIKDIRNNKLTDYDTQLNVYDWLGQCQDPPKRASGLVIEAVLRDWNVNKYNQSAKDMGQNYPPIPYAQIIIRQWPYREQLLYVYNRLNEHFVDLNPCTPEEMWADEPVWAVMKKNRKSALRLLGSEQQAYEWLAEKEMAVLLNTEKQEWEITDPNIKIKYRTPERRKCRTYCSVRNFCPYNIYLQGTRQQEETLKTLHDIASGNFSRLPNFINEDERACEIKEDIRTRIEKLLVNGQGK